MAAFSKFLTGIVVPVVAAALTGWSADAAHQAMVWSLIYLPFKCAAELLVLGWQSLGMPERQRV